MIKTIETTKMPVRYKLILVALSVIAVIMVLVSTTPHGAGLGIDSVAHVAVARGVLSGDGLGMRIGKTSYTEADVMPNDAVRPHTAFPPLFPLLLAFLGGALKVDPLLIIPIVQATIFGLIACLSGLLAWRCFTYQRIAIMGVIAILVSRSLFTILVQESGPAMSRRQRRLLLEVFHEWTGNPQARYLGWRAGI